MRKIAKGVIVGLLGVVVTSAINFSQSAPSPQAANPLIGTWKFNPQKSRMVFSLPPRALTRKYEDRGGGVYIFTQEGIAPDGSKMFSMYVAKDDGAEYPLVIQGADDLGSISVKRIDAYTSEQTEKRNAGFGNGGSTATRVISKDGKTLTLTVKPRQGGQGGQGGAPAEAQTDMDVLVFDKQ